MSTAAAAVRNRSRSPVRANARTRSRSRSRSPKPAAAPVPLTSGQHALAAETAAKRRAAAYALQREADRKKHATELVNDFCRLHPGSRRGLTQYAANHLVDSNLTTEVQFAQLANCRLAEERRTIVRAGQKEQKQRDQDAKADKRIKALFEHPFQAVQQTRLGRLFDTHAAAGLKWIRAQRDALASAHALRLPPNIDFVWDVVEHGFTRTLARPNLGWQRLYKALRGTQMNNSTDVQSNFISELAKVLFSRHVLGPAKCQALGLGERPACIAALCKVAAEGAERMLYTSEAIALDRLKHRMLHSKSREQGLLDKYREASDQLSVHAMRIEADTLLPRTA